MIKITDIIPFIKKGWVAMSEIGVWYWFETKPIKSDKSGIWLGKIGDYTVTRLSNCYDIAPADNRTFKVGGK